MIGFSQHLVDVGDARLEVYRGSEGGIVVCGSQPHCSRATPGVLSSR
ncbi:MAG: hypothetical protein JO352_09060 [Chloroflexi bacterium]|nr:hypothetical protein [Chloroflexota bacterium]MBV9601666.1 hypothetical protein [Chloroflexota bacterium]